MDAGVALSSCQLLSDVCFMEDKEEILSTKETKKELKGEREEESEELKVSRGIRKR